MLVTAMLWAADRLADVWEVLLVVVEAVCGFVTGVSDELRAEMLLARVVMAVATGIAWAAMLVVLMGVLDELISGVVLVRVVTALATVSRMELSGGCDGLSGVWI